MQSIVLTVTLVIMALVALPFIAAIRSTKSGQDVQNTDRRRKQVIAVLVILGLVVTASSLRHWPHAIASDSGVIEVTATSGQWFWELDTPEVPQGRTIVFNVHSEDVTHGFGVYNTRGVLLFQTQAIPGYVTQVQHVFEEPGTYRVLCMEYCGLAHDEMAAEFQVTAQ